jgi:hypothetical protein
MDAARLTDLPMVAPEAGTTTRTPASVRHATFGMSAARRRQWIEDEIKKTDEKMRAMRKVVAEGAKNLAEQFEEADTKEVATTKTVEVESFVTLPKTTVSSLKTGLRRVEAIPFLKEFANAAKRFDAGVAKIVTMTDAQWDAVKADPKYKDLNEKTACWMRECFDNTMQTVKDFKEALLDEDALDDGRLMVEMIKELGTIKHGPSRDKFEEEMEGKAYFTSGMPQDDAKRAVKKFVKDLELIGITDLRTVTGKLVKKARTDSGTNETGWGALSEAIADREADGEPPYSLKVLTDKITVRLAGGGRPTALAAAFGARGKCFHCGERGHMARDCTKSCGECGLRCCPGVRGEKCAVTNDLDLDKCTNAVGEPIDDYTKRKIEEKRAQRKPKVAAVYSGDRPLVF